MMFEKNTVLPSAHWQLGCESCANWGAAKVGGVSRQIRCPTPAQMPASSRSGCRRFPLAVSFLFAGGLQKWSHGPSSMTSRTHCGLRNERLRHALAGLYRARLVREALSVRRCCRDVLLRGGCVSLILRHCSPAGFGTGIGFIPLTSPRPRRSWLTSRAATADAHHQIDWGVFSLDSVKNRKVRRSRRSLPTHPCIDPNASCPTRECRPSDAHHGMAARVDIKVGDLSVCAEKALD